VSPSGRLTSEETLHSGGLIFRHFLHLRRPVEEVRADEDWFPTLPGIDMLADIDTALLPEAARDTIKKAAPTGVGCIVRKKTQRTGEMQMAKSIVSEEVPALYEISSLLRNRR